MRVKLKLSILAGLLLLALIISSVQFVWAAAPPEVWNKTFGGTSEDRAYSVQHTADGGYVLAGETKSYGAGEADAWLIKTDSSGNKTWDKTFGGMGYGFAQCVRQTADGGYFLAGFSYSSGPGMSTYAWIIKTDSSGNQTWDQTFLGTGYDDAFSVQQTADGGYVLAGETGSYGAGSNGAWLIKTDSSGNKTWDQTFGGTGSDGASSVQQTADGGYVLAGETGSYGAGSNDAWLIKTDSSGNKTWDQTFGGTGSDGASSVQQTVDGGYVLAGYTHSYGAGDYDAWLIKVASKAPAPTVTSITPKTCMQGMKVRISNLAGTGFQTVATVRIEQPSSGKVINATEVNVESDTKITCLVDLQGTGAPLGKYDVVVRNPDGQEGRDANGFSVTNICGQGGGAVALGFGLMMGLLSLGGSGLLRRR